MFLIIEDKRSYSTYSFSDGFKYELFEIYRHNDSFFIKLENGCQFSDNTKVQKLEYKKYTICPEDKYYSIDISVYENDDGTKEFNLYKKEDLIISSNNNGSIVSKDPLMDNCYLCITQGQIKTNANVYVNKLSARNDMCISNGERIFFKGIEIIVFMDFYYINSFNTVIRLNRYDANPKPIRYENRKEYPSLHLSNAVKRCVIENPKEYVKPKTDKKELNSIVPNLVMVLSVSFIAGISFYNSYLNDQPFLNRLSFVVMPVAMTLTSIIYPFVSYLLLKRKNRKTVNDSIDDYLKYLEIYENNALLDIGKYLNDCDSYCFSLCNPEDKMFSLKRNDEYFLNISLGKTKTAFEIDYKETGNRVLDKKLLSIKEKLRNIDNYPLMLNIDNYSAISIVSIEEEKDHIFNRVLLELSYKHHYDDLLIAIYSKDSSICDGFYNLPHLFFRNERMTFINEKQLRYLDQIKTDRKIVLLMYDKSSYIFKNNEIHVLYFTCRRTDLLKNNEVMIEYHNRTSHLYEKEKTDFIYYKEEIDFNKYYSYLGKLKNFTDEEYSDSFISLYNPENIEQYYDSHDSKLKAVFACNDDERLVLDLHESGQGPHGLIGGSTGSGKSELIISFLLSLCIKYPPDYLNIVLIDYKGSGLKDSLSSKGRKLPHITASVNNLEENSLKRLIIALNLECRKRQLLFNRESEISGNSVMNLDDYLNSEYRKHNLYKLAHLLIVVDEFAELKKSHPQEIKDLISISRIGRSLGIHLILATQKPSGVIDEEIWSNSRFKIALKVFDERDSLDLIKLPDAAYLNGPGNFIIRVEDEISKYKSFYAKQDAAGNESYKVALLDNMLNTISQISEENRNGMSQSELFINRILEVCDRKKYPIHEFDFLQPLALPRKKLCNDACFVIGEIDDYLNNRKGLLAYGLNDSMLIYTANRKHLNSYLNTLNENGRKTVVIAGRYYYNSYITDCVLYYESEDIIYLLNRLIEENLDVCLFIEDLFALLSYKENYLDLLVSLMKKLNDKKTNVVSFTSNSSISYRLINCFNNRLLLETGDVSNLIDFYAMKSEYLGKSFFYRNEPVCFVPVMCEELVYEDKNEESLIPHIPLVIESQEIDDYVLIGYDTVKRTAVFCKKEITVTSYNDSLLAPYKECEGIKTEVYNNSFKEIKGDLLFIGPGLFKQHLFISSFRNDLKEDEGIYIHSGDMKKVKVLNHVRSLSETEIS